MRAIGILALALASCVPNPPGVDEVLCGWQRAEWWESSDLCVMVTGGEHLRASPNACDASSAPMCVVLRPGESTWLYTDAAHDYDATIVEGDCEALACP